MPHTAPQQGLDNEKIAVETEGNDGILNRNEKANGNESEVSDESFANPTGINEKALVRKLDWKLLPALTLLYLLSFLDRSNSMFYSVFLLQLHLFFEIGVEGGSIRSCELTIRMILIEIQTHSRKCETRWTNDEFKHHWKPISIDTNYLFHWIRSLRSTLQHHT